MAIGLDDALLSWLVASTGDAVVRRLRDAPAIRAMRQVVQQAAEVTVAEVAGNLDGHQAEHLRSSLLVRDTTPGAGGVAVASEAELRAALHVWTAALDRREFGESGYLSELGISPRLLADTLAGHIAAGIWRNGRTGGPLDKLAAWLWRDGVTNHLVRIEQKLDASVGAKEPVGGGLPGGTPDFTGRQQPLVELARRVQAHDPAGTMVAIHAVDGMAGVGKTELALRAAYQHKHRYPDGQYFINLHGYTEGIPPVLPEAALEELLRQAGIPGQAMPPDLAGRQARWQTLMATQRVLVLLDNALDADQVRPLLPNSASCLVLITSRTRLRGLSGARALPLDVLPQAEAIELFARVAGSEMSLDRNTVAAVVDVVGRLPLAVRALAGQVDGYYSESELAGDLALAKERADLVAADGPLGSEVRTALETSLQRLDPPHQRAFRILGVYPGPAISVSQFAALAELSVPQASSTLRTLARRNLITAAADQIGHRRYQLHDLLREYARQQAEAHMTIEEQSASLAHLTTWYGAMIRTIDSLWFGATPAEPEVEGVTLDSVAKAGAWLVTEQDNLLAFARHAAGSDAAFVCCVYAERLRIIGFYTTSRTLYRTAQDVYRRTGNRKRETDTLLGVAQVARQSGDLCAADEHYRAALHLARQTGSLAAEADALLGLGEVARLGGDLCAADEHYRAALHLARQTGSRTEQAAAFWGLGDLASLAGDFCVADDHYRAALDLSPQASGAHERANALMDAGRVAQRTDDHHAAAEHYRAALDLYRQAGSIAREADAVLSLGELALAAGDHEAAREHYRAALGLFQQLGLRAGQGNALRGLGKAARLRGDLQAAGQHYRAAHTTCAEIGNREGEAAALSSLGYVAYEQQRRDEAREHWEGALRIYEEIGNPSAASVRDLLVRLDRA